MALERDRKELERLRSRNKDTERIIIQKSLEADKVTSEIQELEKKQRESSETACTAARKAQMIKDLLEVNRSLLLYILKLYILKESLPFISGKRIIQKLADRES